MTAHFPALIIVVPLVTAFLVTIAGWVDKRWCFPLTAAALLGLQVWDRMDTPEYDKGMGALDTSYGKNPTPGGNFYAPYYNTQVFFLQGTVKGGEKEWENYNKKFAPKLLDAQNPDGSWTKPGGAGGHGKEDAHFMNTALGCLMLEVYYRYLPTTEKLNGLKAR